MPTAIWKPRLRSGNAHCDLEVVVEVRQCPLRPGRRGGGPWDLELAVEARLCPLGSGAGLAVPTWIWSSRWRSGCAHWDLDCEEEAAGEEAEEENS